MALLAQTILQISPNHPCLSTKDRPNFFIKGHPKPQGERQTTAVSPLINRISQKCFVEKHLKLPEWGNSETLFLDRTTDKIIGEGYQRIVYGDHGPYLELRESDLYWTELHHNKWKTNHCPMRFYDEYYSKPNRQGIKVYFQIRPVSLQKNPARTTLNEEQQTRGICRLQTRPLLHLSL